jgi:hypothetical protein
MRKAFKYVPSSAELRPTDVIQLFRESGPEDWIRDQEDPESNVYGLRTNLLVSLWPREDGRFDLRYGYQAVAIVARPRGDARVEALDLVEESVQGALSSGRGPAVAR